MTQESFLESISNESDPPSGLSPELEALWLTKAGRWDEAHDIAQEIPSKTGSWIRGFMDCSTRLRAISGTRVTGFSVPDVLRSKSRRLMPNGKKSCAPVCSNW